MTEHSTESLLEWVECVATRFQSSVDGWTYTRDTGDLEHIRYRSDHTGRNTFFRRLKWGLGFAWDYNVRPGQGVLRFSEDEKRNLWHRAQGFYAYFLTGFRKETNLPDGVVAEGKIITFWEEDGEYITLFGPTVGVKVIEWLRAEPDSEYAKAVIAEMRRVAEMSWPSKKEGQ